ncbi:MAG: hypothetical protein DVS81_17285 [Candidatus Accumulibacter meliphilus]|jgi:hypothetical protein|uniref:Uncharacterized protein n=1 Tax=Candidatus Accumulibacter meliphilus TaxID=2211374 RepID=A0A369XGW8_9PROT|nr:MAG: hypothetical protein DVS81_17285 [Candidatus Accumulibacter meliphilus]
MKHCWFIVALSLLCTWLSFQSASQWRRMAITEAGNHRRRLRADYLTRRVWVWDGKSLAAEYWHLLAHWGMNGERR